MRALAAFPAARENPRKHDGPSVLVIDDEPDVSETIADLARRLGASVETTLPQKDVSRWCVSDGPSLIILDLSLGVTDAVEVLRQLAANGYTGHVMLMSGRDRSFLDAVREIGLRNGLSMLPSLSKPVRKKDLAGAFDQLSFDHGATSPAPDTSAAEFDFDEALRENWIEVWYQPKFDLRSVQMVGAEALMRLRHPELGIVGPDRFLPKKDGLAYEAMTEFLVESVTRDWHQLSGASRSVGLSINASVSTIQQGSFIRMIRETWSTVPNSAKLTVEITEDEAILDLRRLKESAIQLKLYDVDIAIDDFGAGYSSFVHVRDLPFSELKVDKSFVSGCGDNERLGAFCRTAAALAHEFGMRATAEGVETERELKVVADAGFDMVQGYLLARPVPFFDFEAMIRRSEAAI